jgi:hypothetical protein
VLRQTNSTLDESLTEVGTLVTIPGNAKYVTTTQTNSEIIAVGGEQGTGTAMNSGMAFGLALLTVFVFANSFGIAAPRTSFASAGELGPTSSVTPPEGRVIAEKHLIEDASLAVRLPLRLPVKSSVQPGNDVDPDYTWLATNQPDRLLSMIKEGHLRPSKLTFAAEAAGLILDSHLVRDALMPLLRHTSPVVREGAIYGLSDHLNGEAIAALKTIALTDSSRGVRRAARAALDE